MDALTTEGNGGKRQANGKLIEAAAEQGSSQDGDLWRRRSQGYAGGGVGPQWLRLEPLLKLEIWILLVDHTAELLEIYNNSTSTTD